MLTVHVFVHTKPDKIEQFKSASIKNAQQSIKEPGVARFDVLQQKDELERFLLVEVYRSEEDPARHKETEHYKKWRDTVARMMAEPRKSIKYEDVFSSNSKTD
jgi:autoinducer 2-degrading protein